MIETAYTLDRYVAMVGGHFGGRFYINTIDSPRYHRCTFHNGTITGAYYRFTFSHDYEEMSIDDFFEIYDLFNIKKALVMRDRIFERENGNTIFRVWIKQLIRPDIPLDMFYYMTERK